jgi:hypothetical protein
MSDVKELLLFFLCLVAACPRCAIGANLGFALLQPMIA